MAPASSAADRVSTQPRRRALTVGVAWALPAVVTAAAAPMASASGCAAQGSRTFTSATPTTFTIPAGCSTVSFIVVGGQGGWATTAGGAGDYITGMITRPGTAALTVTVIAGQGGDSGVATRTIFGGAGYGKGGDIRGWNTSRTMVSGAGGGGSAILFGSNPIVVAGGGGGGSTSKTVSCPALQTTANAGSGVSSGNGTAGGDGIAIGTSPANNVVQVSTGGIEAGGATGGARGIPTHVVSGVFPLTGHWISQGTNGGNQGTGANGGGNGGEGAVIYGATNWSGGTYGQLANGGGGGGGYAGGGGGSNGIAEATLSGCTASVTSGGGGGAGSSYLGGVAASNLGVIGAQVTAGPSSASGAGANGYVTIIWS